MVTGVKTFRTITGVAKFALICFAPTAIVSSIFAITGSILADDATFSGSISTTDALSNWASCHFGVNWPTGTSLTPRRA